MSTSSGFSCNSQVSSGIFSASQSAVCNPADVPALAATLVELELMLHSSHPTDLEAISSLVRSDVGLTLQVLRLSRAEAAQGFKPWRISDCVVQLGDKLLGIARPTGNPLQRSKSQHPSMRGFWKHCQLLATVAEVVSTCLDDLSVIPEQAYIAGLLHNVDALPNVLELEEPCGSEQDFCGVSDWAAAFNLPDFVCDVLAASRAELLTSELSPLSRVVAFAQCWTEVNLSLVGAASTKQPFLSLPKQHNLVSEFFPERLLHPSANIERPLASPQVYGLLCELANELASELSVPNPEPNRVFLLQ